MWVESLGLYILNVGRVSTCVRHNGESIVDVTIGSPMMARTINSWRVVTDTETLSDHLYIQMNIGRVSGRLVHRPPQGGSETRRWTLTKLNKEALETALTAVTWTGDGTFRRQWNGSGAKCGKCVMLLCPGPSPALHDGRHIGGRTR